MMELWYGLVNQLLPFEWTRFDFMKNALLAVLLIAPVFGILSTMVVNNRMAFFSDSIGHSALTGVAIGVLLGISSPIWSMMAFSIVFSIVLVLMKSVNTSSTDTIIGVFSSTAVALGLVVLSKQGFNKYTTYLIGDLLGITASEIGMIALVLAAILLFWVLAFNRLMVASINPSLAASRGMKIRPVEMLFTVVIAIVVTISIRWVGLLIINSLLVLPAAAARNVARNMRQYHILSVAAAYLSSVSGLILSYYWGTAAGATIVLVAAFLFGIAFLVKYRRG